MDVRLAFLGFGGVGRALVEMFEDKRVQLNREYNINPIITAVSDLHGGSVFAVSGIDSAELLSSPRTPGGLAQVSNGSERPDNDRVVDGQTADLLVEVSYTNPIDGEPGRAYCRQAVANGMRVITTNKGPVAFGLHEISSAAAGRDQAFGYEGSVMSGTPVLSWVRHCLPAANITRFRGILNGTANYILGRMEDGASQADAIAEAQAKGYAEADPTADVEGMDVMMKVIILSAALFEQQIGPEDVDRTGITGITNDMIASAAKNGQRYKLIGSGAFDQQDNYTAKVAPELVPADDVLYGISGAINALSVTCDELGDVMVTGPGAGLKETAYALLSDLIFALQGEARES